MNTSPTWSLKPREFSLLGALRVNDWLYLSLCGTVERRLSSLCGWRKINTPTFYVCTKRVLGVQLSEKLLTDATTDAASCVSTTYLLGHWPQDQLLPDFGFSSSLAANCVGSDSVEKRPGGRSRLRQLLTASLKGIHAYDTTVGVSLSLGGATSVASSAQFHCHSDTVILNMTTPGP